LFAAPAAKKNVRAQPPRMVAHRFGANCTSLSFHDLHAPVECRKQPRVGTRHHRERFAGVRSLRPAWEANVLLIIILILLIFGFGYGGYRVGPGWGYYGGGGVSLILTIVLILLLLKII
jgi:hypothetical protein